MISIITTTHKKRPLLDVTIKSVLCQTYSDFEWVVLDNSKDGYFSTYLEEFFHNNPHLRYRKDKIKITHKVYNEVNIGKFKNDAMRIASCGMNDYVVLLDHDDFLDTKALERIHTMDIQYPLAQFMTGDVIKLYHNITDGMFYCVDFENEITKENMLKQGLMPVSGEVHINIDGWWLDFGWCPNYTLRYYYHINEGYSVLKSAQENTGVFNVPFLKPHPRIIKRCMFENRFFEFYEGNNVADDIVQCLLLGAFAKGCYIENPTVYWVQYSDGLNSSRDSAMDWTGYFDFERKVDAVWESLINLFNGVVPLHNKFLNIT